jgi:uncharacterized membrane protein YuzA (DUF378 family)
MSISASLLYVGLSAQHFATQVRGCGDVCDAGDALPTVEAGATQVSTVIRIVFMVVGVLALVYLILAGFKLITSLGNPEALNQARQSIIYAVIGIVISLSAQLIVTFLLRNL